MSQFSFWSKNDLPDIRLTRDRGNENVHFNQESSKITSSNQKHRKGTADLNSSVTMDVDVDNDLQCPICLELYTYPIILPCSHVLCRAPCAEHLFDFNFIRCPVCRDNCYVSGGISSLPRVIALENIIERYKKEQQKDKLLQTSGSTQTKESKTNKTVENLGKSSVVVNSSVSSIANLQAFSFQTDAIILCENCQTNPPKRAKKFCVTCDKNLCVTCLRLSHPSKEPFISHVFMDPKLLAVMAKGNSLPGASSSSSGAYTTSRHRDVIDSYCNLCRQPFSLNSSEGLFHEHHQVLPIEDAYRELKSCVGDTSVKMSMSQAKVVTCLKNLKDGLKDMQHILSRRRDQVNIQCDTLLAEIENKRSYFLADLEYEERIHQNRLDDHIKNLEKVLGASKGLASYVKDILSSDKEPFLEVASTLNERLLEATLDCESASTVLPPDTEQLSNKVVDCRREKVVLRELHYLSPPATPIVDVTRCSRSENAVVLAICPPSSIHEVVDQYEVHFCSEEQKNVEIEESLKVKNCVEDSCSTKISANASGILVILIENLCHSTTYYFSLSAGNCAGKSGSSEVVQCSTLGDGENVIPVPEIIETLCKRFTSSIQIFLSSSVNVDVEQKISHFLLYRQPSQNRVWKCVSMYGRDEHRVFGLEPNTEYEFVVLAYNLRGECQLSNKVSVQTEVSICY